MTEFKGRISNTNLIEYVNKETQINSKLINGFKPILQDKYGGTNDCTILQTGWKNRTRTDNTQIV